jgi:hypothetical protein
LSQIVQSFAAFQKIRPTAPSVVTLDDGAPASMPRTAEHLYPRAVNIRFWRGFFFKMNFQVSTLARSFLGPTAAALGEPNYQLRRFRTGHHPADQRRRYRRHHLGAEFVTLAEGYTGGEAPNHSAHVGFVHRRCFNDDDTDRQSAGVAKGQHEMRHSFPHPAPPRGLFFFCPETVGRRGKVF